MFYTTDQLPRKILWENRPTGWDWELMGCGSFILTEEDQWYVCVCPIVDDGLHEPVWMKWGPRGLSVRDSLQLYEGRFQPEKTLPSGSEGRLFEPLQQTINSIKFKERGS